MEAPDEEHDDTEDVDNVEADDKAVLPRSVDGLDSLEGDTGDHATENSPIIPEVRYDRLRDRMRCCCYLSAVSSVYCRLEK